MTADSAGPLRPQNRGPEDRLDPPENGPLENIANNSCTSVGKTASDLRKRPSPEGKVGEVPKRAKLRRRRYRGREVNWEESNLKRCRDCGRVAVTPGGSVAVREMSGMVGFAGLSTCGSVWSCGVCNAKIMARRQIEIGTAVEVWRAQGGQVLFGTMTMRHWSFHRLDTLWSSVSKAWGKVTTGRNWLLNKRRHGIVGWLRVVEVTFGERNGWHVHIHYLVFEEPGAIRADADKLKASMFGRWAKAMEALGLPAPLIEGQDLHVLDGAADQQLSRYFTKAVHQEKRIGLELTSSQTKTARVVYGTYSVWKFLDDVIDNGDADALGYWHEFQRASKGRRQLTWSKGLRELLDLRAEKSDEDIAAEELGTRDNDLVLITAAGWKVVIANRLMAPILESVESRGLSGLHAMLDSRGIEYSLVGEAEAAS